MLLLQQNDRVVHVGNMNTTALADDDIINYLQNHNSSHDMVIGTSSYNNEIILNYLLPIVTFITSMYTLLLLLYTPFIAMAFYDDQNATYQPYVFIIYVEITYTLFKITFAFIQMLETKKYTFLKILGYQKGNSILLFIIKHLIYGLVITQAFIYTMFLVQYIIERFNPIK